MGNEKQEKLEFHGGIIGAIIPFISMIIFMMMLVITKHNSMKSFWVPGLLALCLSFFLAKDKKKLNHLTIQALVEPMFATFIVIFFLAGILSQLLRVSGLINGLIWLCSAANVNAKFIPLVIFLVCVIISTACGTTGGTVTAVTPIMFPLAISLGCNPALVLGAIISGSFFGDNLAPISDTTIASSGSMRADVRDVVRSRVKYSVIAGSIAAVLYIVFGLITTVPTANQASVDQAHALTLIMLIVPVVMVIMMLRGAELIPVLLVCNLLALALNLICGFVGVGSLIETDGPIVAGIESMTGVVIFIVWVFIQVGFIKAAGVFDVLIKKLDRICKTPAQAELASMVVTMVALLATASNTVAIVIAGPIVYTLYEKFEIDRKRGANYLDGTACGLAGILPWNNSLMMMFALAVSSGFLPEGFSVLQLIPYSFHCILLLIVYFICAVTGLFRTKEVYVKE